MSTRLHVTVESVAALWVALFVFLCIVTRTEAEQPVVSSLVLTDVSPHSFSATWIASEPSTCTLRVFDQAGQELTGIIAISESAIHPPAEDMGVMKVQVTDLLPETVYHFETITISKATGHMTAYPEDPLPVRTEKSAGLVQNCVLVQEIYTEDGEHALGSLTIVMVEGGSYPITAWVGEEVNPPSPWAWVDMNNIYSEVTHENLQIYGGVAVSLKVLGGMRGYAELETKAPASSQGSIVFQLGPPIVLNCLKGDIDGNHQLNLADAILGLQIVGGLPTGTGWGTLIDRPIGVRVLHCDVDQDMKISMREIIYLIQTLAQLR